ncbi:ABC transporter substrate-binding protein [Candidatus Bipolaricaulota bacterium]|nr:ABC transporter substrate-binding protein [Candidatus Bipolaricaulota bacterium]
MRTRIALIALALMVMSGTTLAEGPVRLVFMGRDGVYESAMRLAISLYKMVKPEVTIEYVGLPWAGLREKIVIELAEGRGTFDLILLDDPWTAEFLPAGLLEPLDGLFAAAGQELSSDFVPSAVALGRWPYPQGTQYALPVVGNVQLFAYRVDLFEKHGLSHPPATWADVVEAAQVIQAREPGVFGNVFRGAPGNDIVTSFLPILWAHGGDVIVDGKSGVDSAEFRAALSVFLALARFAPGDVGVYKAARLREVLLAGNAAMALEVWPAWIPELDDPKVSLVVQKVQLFPHPGQVAKSAPMLGIWLLGIPATSTKKAEAFDFLLYVTSPEIQKVMALHVGNPPTLTSLYRDPELIARYRWYPAQLEALLTGVARPRTAAWSRMEDMLGGFLNEALTGIRSPEDTVRAAHDAITRILAEER